MADQRAAHNGTYVRLNRVSRTAHNAGYGQLCFSRECPYVFCVDRTTVVRPRYCLGQAQTAQNTEQNAYE